MQTAITLIIFLFIISELLRIFGKDNTVVMRCLLHGSQSIISFRLDWFPPKARGPCLRCYLPIIKGIGREREILCKSQRNKLAQNLNSAMHVTEDVIYYYSQSLSLYSSYIADNNNFQSIFSSFTHQIYLETPHLFHFLTSYKSSTDSYQQSGERGDILSANSGSYPVEWSISALNNL